MVLLVATKKLRYDGKELAPGNEFQASEKDAMILRAIEKAKDALPVPAPEHRRGPLPKKTAAMLPPDTPAPIEPHVENITESVEVKSEPESAVEPASAPVEVPPPAPVEAEVAPAPVTPRYKRRDLQAAQE